MSPLPQEIITILSLFAPLFSRRVWPQAQTLLVGALLAPGKRTVSAVLEVVGLSQQPTFQPYHRVVNRCVWSPLAGSKLLLEALVAAFVPQGCLVLGLGWWRPSSPKGASCWAWTTPSSGVGAPG